MGDELQWLFFSSLLNSVHFDHLRYFSSTCVEPSLSYRKESYFWDLFNAHLIFSFFKYYNFLILKLFFFFSVQKLLYIYTIYNKLNKIWRTRTNNWFRIYTKTKMDTASTQTDVSSIHTNCWKDILFYCCEKKHQLQKCINLLKWFGCYQGFI